MRISRERLKMSEISVQNRHKNYELLMSLITARSEKDIDKIVTNLDVKNFSWRPFGNRYDNFKIINNQQADPINALVEKPINSIDHILLKECKKSGIDPHGSKAPRTMKQAVEQFFAIKDGNICLADKKLLQKLSNNILIVGEGDVKFPTVSIVDTGEGVDPSEMKSTILSLDGSNKDRIPFVQGKYGMGGTGVLRFCGMKHYMLILSRKHPDLVPNGKWGFTLVRLVPDEEADKEFKELYYEYLTDKEGNILVIDPQELKILPSDRVLVGGCYIKLYNYNLPHASNITLDLWKDVNKRLLFTALPMRLIETRKDHFKITPGKNDTKMLYGNLNRVNLEGRNDVRLSTKINCNLNEFGVEKIDAIVFKHGSNNRNLHGEPIKPDDGGYTDASNVVYLTRNGQTHLSIGRYKFQNITGFASISNYIVVHVDMTKLPRRSQLFMPSRDRVAGSDEYKKFEELLLDAIANDPNLKTLEEEYRQLDGALGSTTNIFERLLKKYAQFGKFLDDGKFSYPNEHTKKSKQPFKGNAIPTFLKIEGYQGEFPCRRGLPDDLSPVRFTLLTDATDDYLSNDRGKLLYRVTPDGSIHIFVHELHDGRIPATVRAKPNHNTNECPTVIFTLTRPHDTPLIVSMDFSYYQPQKIGGKAIRIEPGAAAKSASLNVNPPLFVTRVGRKVVWENHDTEPHELIIENNSKLIYNIGTLMPGTKGGWKTTGTKSGVYNFKSVRYPWVNGTIKLVRRKERKQPGVNIPPIKRYYENNWKFFTPCWDTNTIVDVVRQKDKISEIRVNMDCGILKEYLASKPASKRKDIEENFLVQVGLYALVVDRKIKDSQEYSEIFPKVMSAVAQMLLPLKYDLKGL